MFKLFERYAEWCYHVVTAFMLKYEDPRPIRKLSGQIFVAAGWLFVIFYFFPLQHYPQISDFVIGLLLIFSFLVFILYLGLHIGVTVANHLDNLEGKKDLDKDSDTL